MSARSGSPPAQLKRWQGKTSGFPALLLTDHPLVGLRGARRERERERACGTKSNTVSDGRVRGEMWAPERAERESEQNVRRMLELWERRRDVGRLRGRGRQKISKEEKMNYEATFSVLPKSCCCFTRCTSFTFSTAFTELSDIVLLSSVLRFVMDFSALCLII